jgi:protocatechuate 3,4-dioxygenase, beta subunit
MSEIIYNKFDRSVQPEYLYPAYKSTVLRAPTKPLVLIKQTLSESTGPVFGDFILGEFDHDLTKNSRINGEPLGERIKVFGKVLNENGQSIPNTLIEIWQANSAGRYVHKVDHHEAPLDPNFLGTGRCMTDSEGNYQFYTIKPGAYPWRNHYNAWRPQHIHFSLFGANITNRLVTQMYFPGDPLFEYDPIFKSVPENARHLLVSKFDIEATEEQFALAYRFDFVLRGTNKNVQAI